MLAPTVLSIEHTLHKGQRFAATFYAFKSHGVFYIALGKSAWELEPFLARLQGKEKVESSVLTLALPTGNWSTSGFPRRLSFEDMG